MKSRVQKRAVNDPRSKYMFVLFFLAVLVLAMFIIRPFISTLLVAAIIAYVFYPVYAYFHRLTNMKSFSAVVLILLLLLFLSLPLIVVVGKVTKESYDFYSKVKKTFEDSGSLSAACAGTDGFVCSTYHFFVGLSERYNLNLADQFARVASSIASLSVSSASEFVKAIPKLLIHVFIGIFAVYYMLVDGKDMLAVIQRNLPMRKEDSERILVHFNDIIYATIYGSIVIALVQGTIATLGYYLFGVSSPIIFGLVTIIAAFIPFLGAALVWLPLSISMLISGISSGDTSLMLKAGGLVMYSALLVSTVDNFLRPKIVGARAGVHPLVILLGVFGGLALFGFAGVMVGPLLLTLFIASLKIYEQEKAHLL